MVHKKRKSKRQPLKLKYDIQKKVKEHKRKLKKLAKQNPHLRKKVKKDPGIPNLWPFKSQMLDAMARREEKMSEEQQRQRESRRKAQEKKRRQLAEQKNNNNNNNDNNNNITRDERGNSSDLSRRKWYMKELKQVLQEADVILEVLDARDPLGCRCLSIEKQIQGIYSQNAGRQKRIILVLNKIDLVPSDIAARWIKYLRREFPVIAFKASTQSKRITHQNVNALQASDGEVSRKACIGGQALMQILKKFSMSDNIKGALTVGIIGYPNVGKSSIINSLKRSKAVGVGAMPGFTTKVTSVRLDKNIQLLDSPGVLVSSGTTDSEADLVLRNCLRVDNVQDILGAAYAIVKRCHPFALLQTYQIAQFETAEQFLYLVAQKRGKLQKGGIPNMEAAARIVLQDWNDGQIPYYTVPPNIDDVGSAQVVTDWNNELKISDIINEANKGVLENDTAMMNANAFMELESNKPMDIDMNDIDDTENNDNQHRKKFEIDMNALSNGNNNEMNMDDDDNEFMNDTTEKQLKASDLVTQRNTQRNKKIKEQKKRERKQARRMAEQENNEMVDENDTYDFSKDY